MLRGRRGGVLETGGKGRWSLEMRLEEHIAMELSFYFCLHVHRVLYFPEI